MLGSLGTEKDRGKVSTFSARGQYSSDNGNKI